MAKMQMITDSQTEILNMSQQHQVAMFRASKQHATRKYHGKQRHGMLLLHALNKTHLVNMLQKPTKMMIASMQTWQIT